ncbi:hypothetical protein RD792_012640 [Penstemon davidsonii]|uniref:Uncharacterized protein n=1 Tax=Penstemon davidsonii TaxID=160366 RepID=A0ABR0CYY0_9LAMI|nr:hypothetical protein RD792_012640 [Penstemon davidsonii]
MQVSSEDIRWVGDAPVVSRLGEAGAPNPVRGRMPSMNQFANDIRPSVNAVIYEDSGEIEIYHTDSLIKKVEKVLDASHPNKLEIDKAKKMLKPLCTKILLKLIVQEHEQALVQVIAKLADACESGNVYFAKSKKRLSSLSFPL